MSELHAAWLVDLDGTLYRATPVKIAMAFELAVSGWGAIRTLRRFRREHELIRDANLENAENPYQHQLERTAAALELDIEAVENVVTEWMQRRPASWIRRFRRGPLLDELASFRQSGGKTALVSDYPAATKLAAIADPSPFDVVVASGDPGGPRRLKPDPEGYLLAARRLGIEPERCLVIGDRVDADGAAAEAAGMAFRLIG